jgi:acid phosphatase family membrane protein YuiD
MEESVASSSSHYISIFTNYPLISAVLAFTIAQFIKFFTSWYKERRWDLKRLVGSGGMPSSHSATVTALALAVGLQEGFGGSHFAIALVLTTIVCF